MGFQLFVKTLTGRTITLEADYNDKIEEIKTKLESKLDHVLSQQMILIFAGKLLQNENTICDYNTHGESTLHVIILNTKVVTTKQNIL